MKVTALCAQKAFSMAGPLGLLFREIHRICAPFKPVYNCGKLVSNAIACYIDSKDTSPPREAKQTYVTVPRNHQTFRFIHAHNPHTTP